MKNYQKLINYKKVPSHVAIIMDGNGRWAKKKSLPRLEGHRQGVEVIDSLMESSLSLGIKAVSLYAFSTENWSRPKSEISGLLNLLELFYKNKISKLKENGIKVRHSGSLKFLPPGSKKIIEKSVAETSKNNKLVLNLCFNYGGRQEILNAVNLWAKEKKPGEELTGKKLNKYLYTHDLPDIDLMIRTSGEYRISNFLLWQIAYSELIFFDVLWPDFKPYHLYKAVYEYQHRHRRFGGL